MQPLTNLPFFEYKNFDDNKGYHVYKLNPEKLSSDECHMFFLITLCEEMIISTALEFLTFHPKTSVNKKFNINPVKCGGIELFWCSFPKNFKETCKKVGLTHGMTMKHFSRVMAGSSHPSEPIKLIEPTKESKNIFYNYFEQEQKSDFDVPRKDALVRLAASKNQAGTIIEFPESDKLLNFQGKRSNDPEKIYQECERIKCLGNSLENLGIDGLK